MTLHDKRLSVTLSTALGALLLACGAPPSDADTGRPLPSLSSGLCVQRIASGWAHSCAVLRDGSLWCWGDGGAGQLGDGSSTARAQPVRVDLKGVTEVAAGQRHTCAVLRDGSLWCWGDNHTGALGDGTTFDRARPTRVLLDGVRSVSVGTAHTCALRASGTVWCWGDNHAGQLGDGTSTDRPAPVAIASAGVGPGAGAFTQVAVGGDHACARREDGSLWCWGDNSFGALGDGTTTPRPLPTHVPGLDGGVAQVVTGLFHTCARSDDGAAWCWGGDRLGQCGAGSPMYSAPFGRARPMRVTGLDSVSSLSAGSELTCALRSDGSAWCWGVNARGECGSGSSSAGPHGMLATPAKVAPSDGARWVALSAGGNHACAVDADGRGRCWGGDALGELGDGGGGDRAVPVEVGLACR